MNKQTFALTRPPSALVSSRRAVKSMDLKS
ncbi:hypothetical protein N748_03810 [Legionella pneumophila str. 121004]|nr:hypothetical protein N748_03810 [Legionella pneumophila str. 121004]ERH42726.1 hypothetical protein N751_16435 [Legionella pneumophila str. Leg01/11]